ncbi:histidine kinase [Aquincola sp. S2]|uniref:Histidine kinase n=1 Tax=Pseudaquabacterium terrae TaxID=2732868 RepID=A0ABX2EGY9_9BURK|nr:histidine kinase [Aquabacterium terrae]NRF67856.1 histidine kinase [Aquabacterium terrae]
MASIPPSSSTAPPGWSASLRTLSATKVAWALGFAVTVAALLNPIFAPPFPVLLGRTIFVALVLLLAFTLAGNWQRRWLPRWFAQTLAVVLAAPLATLGVYLVSTGGDFAAILSHPGRVAGFLWIAGCALFIGLVLATGAMVREREAQSHSLQLKFELERAQLEKQALDARLALLTAQIEPHFLFNTLANVQALVETGSPRAAEVLKSLIAYLRAALPKLHEAGLPTLANELQLVRAYLELMHLRMPDRLQFSVDVPAGLHAERFPAMALLTLVENAVRHGVDPSEEGGRIDVGGARAADGGWRLWVADSGVGLTENAAPGTGLANLRARLQGVFGAGAVLELSEQPPHGVRAEIVIPPAAVPPKA